MYRKEDEFDRRMCTDFFCSQEWLWSQVRSWRGQGLQRDGMGRSLNEIFLAVLLGVFWMVSFRWVSESKSGSWSGFYMDFMWLVARFGWVKCVAHLYSPWAYTGMSQEFSTWWKRGQGKDWSAESLVDLFWGQKWWKDRLKHKYERNLFGRKSL